MVTENRGGESPIPSNLKDVLNSLQLQALQQIERFGWKLKFVRRPLFQEVIPVISNPDETLFAVLENDGEIKMEPGEILRSSDLEKTLVSMR
ncbi:MAG: hypothetical protein KZQ93_18590 [Candidatus Thiodiazotropha sp. (ex Monitilora ramsayi)]|nr:hypothetical protein [Candidatus Thiodiazotropha sp. (ex Monitilora ramsayi)]